MAGAAAKDFENEEFQCSLQVIGLGHEL